MAYSGLYVACQCCNSGDSALSLLVSLSPAAVNDDVRYHGNAHLRPVWHYGQYTSSTNADWFSADRDWSIDFFNPPRDADMSQQRPAMEDMIIGTLVAHDDGRVFSGLCLSVCLSVCVFSYDIPKTTAARITKLGVNDAPSWLPKILYFRIKRSKVKITKHKNSTGAGFCTLVRAGFFCSSTCRLFR